MSKAAELAKMGEVLTNSQIGGRRNIILNGAMQVAQRGTSSTGVGATGGVFPCVDRMKIFAGNTAGRATVSQATDVHDGFANALKFECTTADTSIAADEFFGVQYLIEGQDVQQLKKGTSDAESVTLSFYVKGNASATYTLEMLDNDNDRINTQTFAVTTSWNRVSLNFIPDTTGALDDNNEKSIQFSIWMHAGSTYTSGTFASNTWAARTNGNRVNSSQTSFFDSTDRTFFITGVQLEVGSTATPFEHRSFGEEFNLCSRYYEVAEAYGNSYHYNDQASSSDREDLTATYKVEKRTTPTLTVTNQSSGSLSNLSNTTKKATYRRTGSFGSPAAYSLVSEAEL
tara:strand:- start:103 stop:1131 length:1029 start_codon:yes stop_codon:yes gene_type:complete